MSRSKSSADFFGFGTDAIGGKKNGSSEKFAEVGDDGSKGIFFYGLTFGATEVARKDKGATFFQKKFESREGFLDSSIIGDSQAFGGRFQRDIEVAADKDLFPFSLEVLDGEVGHGESACDVAEQVDTAVAVTPLVVVPTDEFKEAFIQAHARGGIENT